MLSAVHQCSNYQAQLTLVLLLIRASLLPLIQVVLQLEKKLFNYVNQDVFRENNGSPVSHPFAFPLFIYPSALLFLHFQCLSQIKFTPSTVQWLFLHLIVAPPAINYIANWLSAKGTGALILWWNPIGGDPCCNFSKFPRARTKWCLCIIRAIINNPLNHLNIYISLLC